MFKRGKNRIRLVSEGGNVYYMPENLTVEETQEILYSLYGEFVDWTTTALETFTVEAFKMFGYELRNYASQNPKKTLLEIFDYDNLEAYAEKNYREALWYDIQDAKEQ